MTLVKGAQSSFRGKHTVTNGRSCADRSYRCLRPVEKKLPPRSGNHIPWNSFKRDDFCYRPFGRQEFTTVTCQRDHCEVPLIRVCVACRVIMRRV